MNLFEYYSALGAKHQKNNDFESAFICYEACAALHPNISTAYYNIGQVLQSFGMPSYSIAHYNRSIFLDPYMQNSYVNFGVTMMDLKKPLKASNYFKAALCINPIDSGALFNLSLAKYKSRIEAATCEATAIRAIILEKNQPAFYAGLAYILEGLDPATEALSLYMIACAIDPSGHLIYSNLGGALKNKKLLDSAEDMYKRAIYINPSFAVARWNLSLLLLLKGDYENGWALYEWRKKCEDINRRHVYHLNELTQRTMIEADQDLFIYTEQGLGDTIQFARYLPLLVKEGARVTISVDKSLVSVIQSVEKTVSVVERGNEPDLYDKQCSLLSLPWIFNSSEASLPCDIPYINVSAEACERHSRRIGPKRIPRIGIAWSGNRNNTNDSNRSLRLSELSSLISNDFEWHSLQVEYRESDLTALSKIPQITQHNSYIIDFMDTAALISNMDLVISVDTSVAHLAGALGKPVWILLAYVPDYRWMLDKEESPWYPTASLFRQKAWGQWSDVIGRIKNLLKEEFY